MSRIEGQVHGVKRMVDEAAYCIDLLTQSNAIKAAIDQRFQSLKIGGTFGGTARYLSS